MQDLWNRENDRDKTYRILCWTVLLCAALVLSIPVICFTGLGTLFLCKLAGVPETVEMGLLIVLSAVCYVFLVWAGRRFLLLPDRSAEPSGVSRGASAALWLGIAFLLCLAFFWCGSRPGDGLPDLCRRRNVDRKKWKTVGLYR